MQQEQTCLVFLVVFNLTSGVCKTGRDLRGEKDEGKEGKTGREKLQALIINTRRTAAPECVEATTPTFPGQ